MEQARTLRVVVASPGDVAGERDAVVRAAEEVNRSVAEDRGLLLRIFRWETDTHPGFHAEGPQGIIDEILGIQDCDLLIGIFWRRFGTPTADGKTGTEHEIQLAYEAWREKGSPQIMVYFKQKAYEPRSKEEALHWAQVLEFKDRFPKEGLWWPYKAIPAFESLLRGQLSQFVKEVAGRQPMTARPPTISVPAFIEISRGGGFGPTFISDRITTWVSQLDPTDYGQSDEHPRHQLRQFLRKIPVHRNQPGAYQRQH